MTDSTPAAPDLQRCRCSHAASGDAGARALRCCSLTGCCCRPATAATYSVMIIERTREGRFYVREAPERIGVDRHLLDQSPSRFLQWNDERLRVTADNGTWVYAWVGTDRDGEVLIGERRD